MRIESSYSFPQASTQEQFSLRDINNPDHLSPRDLLRKLAQLSDELFEGHHPNCPTLGLADGTFSGQGELTIDQNGCVVLTRVANDENHLTKDWANVSAQELMDTSLSTGGGQGIPTSGLSSWHSNHRKGQRNRVVGIFRIPVKDLCTMMENGNAVIGNIGEGEITLNPQSAQPYLTEMLREPDRE